MIHESQIPRSCDLCYTNKEKCKWVPGRVQCERCCRIGRSCETKRPLRRLGRPARSSQQTANQKSTALASTTRIRTANCDDNTSAALTRPAQGQEKPDESLSSTLDASLWRAVLSSSQELSHHELACLYRAIHDDDFLQQFLLGPSFCEAHRQKLIFHLLSSSSIVLDGYLACALSFADTDCSTNSPSSSSSSSSSPPAKSNTNAGYKHAAAALVKLRSLTAADRLQTTSCLLLGWHILHFVLKLGGHELLDICAQTLALIKPNLGPDGSTFDHGYSSFLTSAVLTETAEALLKTRRPTLRLDPATMTPPVDGCVGISATLLPHLHDLALINVDMREQQQQQQYQQRQDKFVFGWFDQQTRERLDGVYEAVRLWKPPLPGDFGDQYTRTEVVHMTCQALALQTACLLVVHRLRHPFGVEDAVARALSGAILSQLDMAVAVTGRVPRAVDFPLIVSCLEVEEDGERATRLRAFSPIGSYSGKFHRRVERLTEAFWVARRGMAQLPWSALGDILGPIF